MTQQRVVLNKPCKLMVDAQTKIGKLICLEAAADLFDNYNGRSIWDTSHLPKLVDEDGTKDEGRISVWVYFPKNLSRKESRCDGATKVGIVAKMKQTTSID